jgi:hypothetical protein
VIDPHKGTETNEGRKKKKTEKNSFAGNVGIPRRLLLVWLRGEASGA